MKDELENIVRIVPSGSCPFCCHKQFIVSEIQQTDYLTNKDGEIIDSIESIYDAIGYCTNCNKQYQMKPICDGFIPMTPLRLFMDKHIDYSRNMISEVDYCRNPIFKED